MPDDKIPKLSKESTYSDAARAYFKLHRVFSCRLKKISDMTDKEVVQKCHWWQEEHHMVQYYWDFVKANFPNLG